MERTGDTTAKRKKKRGGGGGKRKWPVKPLPPPQSFAKAKKPRTNSAPAGSSASDSTTIRSTSHPPPSLSKRNNRIKKFTDTPDDEPQPTIANERQGSQKQQITIIPNNNADTPTTSGVVDFEDVSDESGKLRGSAAVISRYHALNKYLESVDYEPGLTTEQREAKRQDLKRQMKEVLLLIVIIG